MGRVFGGGNCSGPIAAAAALNASERYDFDSETFIVEPQCVTGSVTHTLTAEGFDASEGGTGRGQPIVPTMGAGGHSDSHANGGVMPAVAYSIMPMNSGKDYKARATDIAQPIMAGGPVGGNQGGDYIVQPSVAYAIQERAVSENLENGPQGKGWQEGIGYTLEARNKVQAVGIIPFDTTQLTSPLNYSNPKPGDPCHPLAAGMHPPSVCAAGGEMAVRRLMPVECERLQGFPDNWTRIPVRFYRTKNVTATRPEDMWEYGWGPNEQPGWWLMAADGPRYKQCGNSMAVKVMAWLGGRIKGWLDLEPFRELIG